MATTILKNIKTNKKGNPHAHLHHSIHYILNPEKTEDGFWTGSNCGSEAQEIYEAMIQTKRDFQKLYGRQGYHYVISFAPGEATEEQAFKVGKEFCQRYLKDYDYCFAVHNDHPHMHVHIVFNSIDRVEGYKYQYRNGDWEKQIQPLVDEICVKNDLSALSYDVEGKRVGKNYAEHAAEKEGRVTGKDIIRRDIDVAIYEAASEADFFRIMKGMGYTVRKGYSERLGQEYVAYTAPGLGKARRDYNLGPGYTLQEVRYRIAHKELEVDRVQPIYYPKENLKTYRMSELNRFQICSVIRVRQAINYHIYVLKDSDQGRVRNDLLKIDELRRECNYLLDNHISNPEEIRERLRVVRDDIREINAMRKEFPTFELDERRQVLMEEKRLLMHLEKEMQTTLAVDVDAPKRQLTFVPEPTPEIIFTEKGRILNE